MEKVCEDIALALDTSFMSPDTLRKCQLVAAELERDSLVYSAESLVHLRRRPHRVFPAPWYSEGYSRPSKHLNDLHAAKARRPAPR